MIQLPLPDKYIRKSIFDLCNGMVVNTETINFYDSRITGRIIPNYYVLFSTQTNGVDESSKCGYRWQSSILLDIVTRYPATNNTGSRLLVDDIANEIRNRLESHLVLDPSFKRYTPSFRLP